MNTGMVNKLMSFYYTHQFPRGSMFYFFKKRDDAKTQNKSRESWLLCLKDMTLVLIARHMTRNKLILSAMYHCPNPLKLNQFLGISNYGNQLRRLQRAEGDMQK